MPQPNLLETLMDALILTSTTPLLSSVFSISFTMISPKFTAGFSKIKPKWLRMQSIRPYWSAAWDSATFLESSSPPTITKLSSNLPQLSILIQNPSKLCFSWQLMLSSLFAMETLSTSETSNLILTPKIPMESPMTFFKPSTKMTRLKPNSINTLPKCCIPLPRPWAKDPSNTTITLMP